MAKKKGTHKKAGMTIPLAVVAGLGVPAIKVWEARTGGPANMVRQLGMALTGYDFYNGGFYAVNLKNGLLPIVAGMAVHKYIGGTLGVNRMLANSGVPLIRL